MIVQPVVELMEHYTALAQNNETSGLLTSPIDTIVRRHRREEITDTDMVMVMVVMGDDVEFCNDIKVWSVEAAAGYL